MKVTVWPYSLHEKRGEIVPDRERWNCQEGKPYFTIDTSAASSLIPPSLPSLPPIPVDYSKWIEEFHSTVPLEQLARKGEVVLISLPAVYVSLETVNPDYKPKKEKGDEHGKEHEIESEEPRTVDIEELLSRERIMLLEGKAGMGKTTLIKHLAYSLTHGGGPPALRDHLPVLVFLKDLWPLYMAELEKESSGITIESLLESYFKKENRPLSMEVVKVYLSHHRALFLMDGLDEVPEDLRPGLIDLLNRFRFEYKENAFLVTGRPHGVKGKAQQSMKKYLRDIEPLDDKKSGQFITRWFKAVSGQATGIARVNAVEMISDVRHHEHAAVFKENPLLLTGLCILYAAEGKRIPDQRA
ncbi:MAG: NACHT domain-containing protein, partial [bacterium]|nr:NACHT domain-containing protein [bacterium]